MSHTLTESRKATYLEDLKTLLRIPSVSTDPNRKDEVKRCAEEVARQMKEAGLQGVEIMSTPGHPVVYGEYKTSPDAPTALIYGHYDVQPEDPIELWTSPPFEPTIRDGKLYARGATDDKGQFLCHIKAVSSMLEEEKTLPLNLKFIIEGEEEIGSPNLAPFLENNKEKKTKSYVDQSKRMLLSTSPVSQSSKTNSVPSKQIVSTKQCKRNLSLP